MGVRIKSLVGWLKHNNMGNSGWFNHWRLRAKEAEEKGNELIVIEIPSKYNSEIIEQIELLLNNQQN